MRLSAKGCPDGAARLTAALAATLAFLAGAAPAARADAAAKLLAAPDGAPLGRCPANTSAIEIAGGTLCTILDPEVPAAQAPVLRAWLARAARIVADYYGHFPARRVVLAVHSSGGGGVHGGHTNNEPRLQIDVTVGRDSGADQLSDDWVLVHEMIHLALPEVGRRHDWLAEGLATYVEGIARARDGNRAVGDVWAEYRASMPRGLPQAGEGGMDQTPTWARTYWGGALFCLLADVAIHEQTANRAGLDTALRAILGATGGYGAERDIEEVLRIGDGATGTRILEEAYARMGTSAVTPDLPRLWARLGVPQDPRSQPFDENAPLAAVRRAITSPAANPR